VLVDHKTAAGREIPRAKQLSAACVATNRETLDLKGEFQRIANRKIIVKDDHHDARS
jgi:hypothetical protein